jgi:hypothetical protein
MKPTNRTVISDRDAELMSGCLVSPDRLNAADRRDRMKAAARIGGTEGLIQHLLERKLDDRRQIWRSMRRTWRRYSKRHSTTSLNENWLKRRLELARLLDRHKHGRQEADLLHTLAGAICGRVPH